MDSLYWYWTIFGSFVGMLVMWILVTATCCTNLRGDYWTPQMKWITATIIAPVKWVAGLVTAPMDLLREYWAHKEKMQAASMEDRLRTLENIAIGGGTEE